MKPLLILMRIAFVGIFWSIFFLEGIRVILLTNWRFDMLRSTHWEHAWKLWLSGWVIKDSKEWAFILIILTFIPLWLTGWAALSMIQWGKIFEWIFAIPLKLFNDTFGSQFTKITNSANVKVVKKKKSYKEIRPRSLRPPMESNMSELQKPNAKPAPHTTHSAPLTEKPANNSSTQFNHSLFEFDDEDSTDFDFDLFEEKTVEETKPVEQKSKPKQENNHNREKGKIPPNTEKTSRPSAAPAKGSSNSSLELLKQKGYEVISGVTIKNTLIDFIALSETQLCMCLNDKEPGDWLADEERFNDEEPLWFSESSHRISPVRKIDIARQVLKDKLTEADLNFEVQAYVIEQIGNIINAEDMFEIWDELDIKVTRIDRGTPKELKLFAKALDDAERKIAPDKFEKVKKLIRSIA